MRIDLMYALAKRVRYFVMIILSLREFPILKLARKQVHFLTNWKRSREGTMLDRRWFETGNVRDIGYLGQMISTVSKSPCANPRGIL